MNDVTDETEVRVILARLEGKLDANLAAHGGDINALKTQNADQESRIRATEKEIPRVEGEISRVEQLPRVTPKQLWLGLSGTVGVIAAGSAAINSIAALINN